MKHIPSIGLTLSLLCSVLPPAFAASVLIRAEPSNGFVRGKEPEWTAVHEALSSNIQDHRPYHRDAEVAHIQWHSLHLSERGTTAFVTLHRAMHQERNMSHRKVHMGWDLPIPSASLSRNSNASVRVSSLRSSASRVSSVRSSTVSSSTTSSSTVSSSSTSSSNVSSISTSSSQSNVSAANANQASVALGTASTFGVLAGSTVANIGATIVTGQLGVSPGSAVTGFGPGVVTGGSIHLTDTLAAQAKLDLTVAYNDLAGRTLAPVSVAGNLGGSTLSPGLYKSTSGLEVSSGDLTLDAKGDANAIFIFQIASTLNVSTGRQVILIGGAKASNVYWQVGTSANLEANAVFKGSILADQSISLQTGAVVEGRS